MIQVPPSEGLFFIMTFRFVQQLLYEGPNPPKGFTMAQPIRNTLRKFLGINRLFDLLIMQAGINCTLTEASADVCADIQSLCERLDATEDIILEQNELIAELQAGLKELEPKPIRHFTISPTGSAFSNSELDLEDYLRNAFRMAAALQSPATGGFVSSKDLPDADHA